MSYMQYRATYASPYSIIGPVSASSCNSPASQHAPGRGGSLRANPARVRQFQPLDELPGSALANDHATACCLTTSFGTLAAWRYGSLRATVYQNRSIRSLPVVWPAEFSQGMAARPGCSDMDTEVLSRLVDEITGVIREVRRGRS